MARIRTIKPEFWTSEQVVECSPNARLMFIGLMNFVDDNGVHPAKPMRIKMQVFPGDGFGASEISDFISELENAGLIRCYEVDGEAYLQITGFTKHQRIDQPSYKFPLPNGKVPENPRRRRAESSENSERKDGECSPNKGRTEEERSPPEGNGREGSGMEGNGGEKDSGAGKQRKLTYPDEFEQAWKGYPKRPGNNKRDACKAWEARVKAGADPDDILAGVQRYAAFCRITGKTGTEFVKQGATFFGPSEHYLDDWTPPPPGGGSGQRQETPHERGQRMARERGIIQ